MIFWITLLLSSTMASCHLISEMPQKHTEKSQLQHLPTCMYSFKLSQFHSLCICILWTAEVFFIFERNSFSCWINVTSYWKFLMCYIIHCRTGTISSLSFLQLCLRQFNHVIAEYWRYFSYNCCLTSFSLYSFSLLCQTNCSAVWGKSLEQNDQ